MNFDRRTMMAGGAALTLAAPALFVPAPALAQRRASAGWFDRGIVIDGLGVLRDPYEKDEILRWSQRGFDETMATGVTMLRDTIFPVGNIADPWGEYQKAIKGYHNFLAANPDRLVLVRSAADILKAKREKKFSVLIGTQDSVMVGPELDRLAQLKKDGVLSVQLTYNNRNLAGDGALEPANAGLSRLGRKTIERIEAERLLLDLSHGGARTMAEAAAMATRPLVISHTGARALHDHVRNTADSTIRAVADKGGVVGLYFMPFLTADGKPRGSDLIAHIEHVARVAGEDHVGLGSDNGVLPWLLDEATRKRMDEATRQRIKLGIAAPGEAEGVYTVVGDYNSIDRYRRLARDLERRGWSSTRLEKLFGGNFLRVYREAWGG